MRKALVLTLVIVAAMMAVPFSSATVINATINTNTNEGYVNATSNYVLYYTYPSNSSTSSVLNGTVIWMNATSYLNSSGRQQLEQNMNEYENENQNSNDSNHQDQGLAGYDPSNSTNSTSTTNATMPVVHVVNATLKYQLHAFATSTNLTIYRNLTINLKISNITKKVGNNTTIIDMSWRAFRVQGELMGEFRGKLELMNENQNLNVQSDVNTNMDVNMLGSLGLGEPEDHGDNNFQFGSLFMNDGFNPHILNFATIDFHVFSVPLQQWTRVYNSATNSTTFYYNASTSYSLNESISYNGNNYTLKLKTDPSASITTNGNAQPTSSNELMVTSTGTTPTTISQYSTIIIVGIVVVVALGVAAVLIRQRTIKK